MEFDGGVFRVWNSSAQHARKAVLRPGLSVILAADTNTVLFLAGVPSGATGANGDVSVDWSGNAYYTKASGTWTKTGDLYAAAGGGGAVSSVAGRTGAVTLTAADLTDSTAAGRSVLTAADAAAQRTAIGAAAAAAVGTASGIASLDSAGKLPTSQLPDLAITTFLGTVASQTAMLALTGQRGDWCIRSDTGTVFVLSADNASLIGSWTQMSYPAAPVASVAGKTGAVTLTSSDVGLGNVNNTSDASKPISTATQSALDTKAPLASPAFTGNATATTQAVSDNSTRVATTAFVKSQPAAALTSEQATVLTMSIPSGSAGKKVVLATEVGGRLTLSGSIVPRMSTKADLMLTSGGPANELAISTDTGEILRLVGGATPGGYVVVPLMSNLVLNTIVVGGYLRTSDSSPFSGSGLVALTSSSGGVELDTGDLSSVVFVGLSGHFTGSNVAVVGSTTGTTTGQGDFITGLGGVGQSAYSTFVGQETRAQSDVFLAAESTNATPVVLESPGASQGFSMPPDFDVSLVEVCVIARVVGTENYARFIKRLMLSATGGVIGTVSDVVADYKHSSLSSSSISVSYSTGSSTLSISCTGVSATTISWRAVVRQLSLGAFSG